MVPMRDNQRHRQSESASKLRLGGIKFSDVQVQVSIPSSSGYPELASVLTSLTKNRVNLTQLFLENDTGSANFCLDEKDYQKARNLIDGALEPYGPVAQQVTSPIGTLTLFPHGSNINVLLCVLQVFSEHDLPIHGMTSSLSALCINTDYDLLDRAADLLLKVFDLPEDHSPFRYQPSALDSALHHHQPGRKVETVASYWEPVIRIYGSNLKTGLAMFNIYFAKKQLAQIGSLLSEVKGLDSFEMMTLSQSGSDDFCLVLLFKPTGGQQEELSIRNGMEVPGVVFSERSAVEVLYFHGPHFQDRYGVMDTAVKALKNNETEIHAANCSGTSVYLVTGDTIGGRALDALAEVFVVPKTY